MGRQFAIAGWGLFCASSWTWCIGMYLPVLLLRHFGWPGVLAFAIPNVAGCVAFGYVCREPDTGRSIPARHTAACAAFSLATVAFHLFFAAFVVAYLIRPATFLLATAILAAVGLFSIAYALSRLPRRAWPAAAVAVYGVSLLVLVRLGLNPVAKIGWQGDLDGWRLAALVPTLAFGFLLCPYLDLTFHRALAESPSRQAFAVFGVAFGAMILVSCVYWNAATVGLASVVIVHLTCQSAFTVAAHLRELRGVLVVGHGLIFWLGATAGSSSSVSHQAGTGGQATRGTRKVSRDSTLSNPFTRPLARWLTRPVVYGLLGVLPFAGVPVALLPLVTSDPAQAAEGMYLRFLVFYGLVFPLYVLWFVGPWAVGKRTRRRLLGFAGFVLLAAPFYELGFLHALTWLPLIPVGAALGWAAGRRRALGRKATSPISAPAPRTPSLVD